MPKGKILLNSAVAFLSGGCTAVNEPTLTQEELDRYCRPLADVDGVFYGYDKYENKNLGELAQADADFVSALINTIKNGEVSRAEYDKFWKATKNLDDSGYSFQGCGHLRVRGIIKFLTGFYDSALLTYQNKKMTYTDEFSKILADPREMLPVSCFYVTDKKYVVGNPSLYSSWFRKSYNQEINRLKQCLAPYKSTFDLMEQGRIATYYKTSLSEGELEAIAQKASRARAALKILLRPNGFSK
ncbi:MAG: hypothetical protein LUC34_08075 [Campylobacter sp.]|nr:hypothetical protein [Campylobacter sp.]